MKLLNALAASAALAALCAASQPAGAAKSPATIHADLHWVAQEIETAGVLDELKRRGHTGVIAIRDVSLVDAANARVIAHQTMIVRNGKIDWVGDAARAPDAAGAFTIDGKGLYLAPGLTDMHVHTDQLSEQLLRIATGTTSFREMDGFPWMLETRRAIQSDALLAPNAYIAGTIIADQPFYGYAVVVRSEDEARKIVRDQKVCGYDFIKVHNSLAERLFDAVADQAHTEGMDLVGHIPHGISIDHALHSAHMRTVEHLKGFINDRNLIVSEEDYAKATAGAEYWQAPSLYTSIGYLHGDAAKAELAKPAMQYVPLRRREEWLQAANATSARDDKIHARLTVAQQAAIDRLLPLHPRWLVGTDAAGYNFNIPGYALLDEIDLMASAGIPHADILRAATLEPAKAMRQTDFGGIMPGMRADLVMLGQDPTKALSAFRDNRGVMLRGRWLARADIDNALTRLAAIEAEPDADFDVSAAAMQQMVAAVRNLSTKHIALEAMHLAEAVQSLRDLGLANESSQLEMLVTSLQTGACAQVTPQGGD